MEIKALEAFVELANSLHFAQTAEQCHMSPSTLSRLIQRIEQQVGCELLLRDNRSVRLTPAGEQFLQFAEHQIGQWQMLQLNLSQQQDGLKGKLHLYCSVTAAYSHLPPLLDRFRQQHPLVEIMLTTGDAADAILQVQQQAVDIAIAAHPDKLATSLHFHPVAEIPLVVIAPAFACPVQQILQQQPLHWPDVPIILPDHGPARTRFEHWYRKKNQGKANIYATVSGHEALVSMVAVGCGVGIVPKVVVENSPVKDRVQYLECAGVIAPFELGVCCLNANRHLPVVDAFFHCIDSD